MTRPYNKRPPKKKALTANGKTADYRTKMAGVGKGGNQKDNIANNLKTGEKINRRRLVVGNLPKEMLSVRREGRAYRRNLEKEVEAVKGEISTLDAHLIDTASCATVHAAICRWLLRKNLKKMNPSQILACSTAMVKAKKDRDEPVKELKLDAKPEPVSVQGYIEATVQ